MSRELRAEWLPRAADAEWARFVAASSLGSAYSLPAFLDALVRAGGGHRRTLAVRKGDDLVAGVGVYERDLRLGTTVRPRLLLFYNGVVLRDDATAYPSQRTSRLLHNVDALAASLERERYVHLELRTRAPFQDARPFEARGWRARPSYSYVVRLGDLEAQWARTEQNLRRLVTRCGREGYELTVDGRFDEFFALHEDTHARKGAPLYLPRDAFGGFYEELRAQQLARLYHAVAPDGQVAASQLVLLGHPVTHTVTAATHPDHARAGAAAFLRWKAFEHLAADGFEANDLTDATLNPVTHFKGQLGGELTVAPVVVRTTRRAQTAEAARNTARRARDRIRRG